uniref:Uncharacterized protein n=1 Tax=Avena sativa TaxID=4498 RepID=A0ACD5XTM5_AVESA
MAGLGTGAPIVKVYHEKSMILPDVSRVLACLYEKNIEVERHPSSSYKGLLRLQASSHVPVPFDDGLTFLEDSREICRYVAETYEHHGYPFLLGKDSLERASIEQWLHHEEHAFNPPSRSLFCHLAFPLAEEDDDIDLQKRKLEEVLEVYEQRLGDSEFLAGNKFTLADLVHLPNSHHIRESDKFVYLYDSRKNVQRWWNAISTRDSWQKVLKDIQVVEQQRKQEELEKQQQRQWLREHPPRTRRRFRLDSRGQTSTKSQTILVPPPVDIIPTSPTASQAEKPLPTETFPDETLLSTPTPHKSSAVQSKHTAIFTTQQETSAVPTQSTPRLPGYPHIPVQSTNNSFIPATSPTTAENPSRTGADKPEIRGVSLPSEATERNLTGNSKRSSSNEVSHNLRVFHFYEASSHTDDAEPYIEPAAQKPSDRISETDGPSNATDHVKTSPRSAKEDSGASGFWTDNTATNADTLDKKSVHYTEQIPQRPAETIYGGSTDQKATYTSPGKHGSTEAHQELQTKKWHGTAAGLSNLKGETDYSMPTQQVEPGKDVQHGSSQDSEQVSTHPLAQEPVSMDKELIQGPEMTPRTLNTDQKRDVSSVLWQRTADVRGIAEDKASSDYRDGVLPPYAQKHADEAKFVSADHRKDASQDAAPPSKQAASEGPRRVTAPYPAAQEFIKSTRGPPSDTWRAPPPLPRRQVDDHSTAALTEKRYPGTGGTVKEVEENTSMPRQVAGGDAKETLEETKFAGSAASRAQPLYYDGTDAPSRQQDAIEDPLGATSTLERRYADVEDTKHSRDTAFKPSKMVGQDARRVATTPSKQAAEDALSVSPSPPKGYPRAEETSKQPSDTRVTASKTRPIAAQDAKDIFRESKVADSTSSIEQPSDARAAASFQKQEVPDARNTSASFQKRYPDVKGATKKSKVTFEETTSPDSASSRVQPLDSQRDYAPSWKKEAMEAPRATSPFKQRHSDVEDTAKHSDGPFKPRKIVGQDTQGTYEETKASEFGLLREQYSDTSQAATTPTEKVATEVGPGVSPPSERNVPSGEDTTTQPRGTASAPRRTTAGDASGAFQDSNPADSVSSREKPLGARQPVVTPSRQETEDSLSKISAFHKTRPFIEDSTGQGVDTVFVPRQIGAEDAKEITEETNVTDSASSVRARPTYTPRTSRPLSEQVEVEEDAQDKDREGRESFSAPKKMVSRDAEGTYGERKTPRSVSTEQFLNNPQGSSPLKQEAAEDSHGATRVARAPLVDEAKHSQGVKGATKKSEDVTFEETKSPDSASSRVQPLDSQRDYAPSWKKEATEAPRATSPFKQRHSDVEDTAKHSRDNVLKPRQMVGEDTQGTYEETKASDFGLLREQSSDTRQAATTPTEKVATEDGPSETPPSERNAPSDEDTNMRPRGTASAPRRGTSDDARGTFQEFHKTRPFIEDSTRQGVDTAVGPRQSGAEDAKDIADGTNVADSASSVRARPTYTPRIAHPLSEQAEVEEDARDNDREGRETISAPMKMVSRDGEDTYGERKIPHSASREQSLDNLQASSPLKQAEAEDPRSATRGAKESLVDEPKTSQGVKGASKKSVGTAEETKGPGSTLHTAQPVSAQDAQRTEKSYRTPTADQLKDAPTQLQSNLQDTYKEAKSSSAYQKGLGSSPSQAEAGGDDQAIMGEKVFSSEQLRKMPKESRSASTKAQPEDSGSPTKVERTPSVYQEDHFAAPDSHQQPQILPTGVRADGSTPKRQQAPVVPSTSDEKSTPSTPPRAKAHDDHTTEEPVKRDTVDNPKGAPLLLGREPTSQVQRATELAPDGDTPNKPSSIDQWRLTSAPIQGVTPNSGDDVQGVSTIDQKPTPMSQQSIPSARGADGMVKGEQRMVPSAPAGAQTPDVQHDPSSFAGVDRTERDGEPVQMQAPTLHARPTSVPTRRAIPDARDAGDNEFVDTSDAERWKALKAKHDSAMIDEDVRDASLLTHYATGDNKTKWQASEAQVSDPLPGSTATPVNVQPTIGDELVERFSHDQGAKRPESTQTQTPSDPPRDSVSAQGVPSDALDKTKFVKPSSTEGIRPTAGPASAFEAQLAEHKFAPSDKKSAGAAQPLSSVESRKEDTAADQTKKPQTIFRQEARPSTPITKQVPSSNTYHGKVQQVTLDNLPTNDSPTPSYEQVSHAPQTIPVKRDMTPAPATSNSPASNTQIPSVKFQEAIPDNYRPDELTVPFVSSEKQDDKDITKYPSSEAPVLEYRPDSTPADSNVHPTSGDEPGISPDQGAESPTAAQETNSEDRRNEVFPAEKKFAPSDQDSVNSVQQRSLAETRKGENIVAAAEQTLPTNIGQQHTQDMRETPTSDFVPAEDIPSDAQSGKSDEQKFASPDQDTQQASSVEPRNEEIRNSIRSAQPLFSAADDQTKGPQTTIGQQGIAPKPGTSKSPSSDTHHASGKFQEVAPDDHHTVESFPSQGQVSRTKPSFVPSEGPTHDSHTDIDKKTTKLPSSQAQSSDLKPDPRQNRSDEPPTRFLPSQLPKQNAETQALAPPVGSHDYDSKSSQDVTSDTLGKAKSPKPSSINQEASGSALTPDTHLGSAPGEVAPAGQKLLLKDQDSAHPTQKSSSSEPTKEQSTVAAPNEAKTPPTIFSQQDPSSGSQYVPRMLQEITPKDQRITGSIPRQQQVPHISKPHDGPTPDLHSAFVEEPMAHTTGPTPHAAPSGLSPDVEKFEISDKDSDHHTQLSSSFGSRKEEGHVDASDQTKMPAPGTGESSGEVLEVGPGNHESKPLPVVEARNKESTGAGQQDIRHAPGILENVLDDDHNKEPVPMEEQVSHDQRASEPHEGSPPDVHGASHDKKTTPPSNQAQSSDAKHDLLPMSVDVDPSSGQQSTPRFSRVQGTQLPALTRSPPHHGSLLYSESNEDLPESSKPPSANQEVTSPKVVPASAPDTMLGTSSDEIAPDGHNFPLSARDLARSAQRPFSVEPTKEKDIVVPSDQTNKARTIIGQQGVSPTDKGETPFDLHASELANPPNEDQEQVHAGSAYEKRERPTGDTRGAVDEKMPHPSSQAENSDITPDSAPITGDAHRTSVDGPVQSPHEAPFDLSSDGKPTMIKGEQANIASNVSLSASPAVGQSENSAVKRPLSEESVSLFSQKNLERTLPEEKSKQQTDQSSTRLSNDDNIEASGTKNPNIETTGDLQPSPLKESMRATEGSRNQEQADQDFFRSTQDNKKKTQENESQDNESGGPKEIRPDSAPISGDGPDTSSLHDSQEQPPAGTLNVPAVFLEKLESRRPPSTDQELTTSKTSPAPAPDAPQDQDSARSPQLPPSAVSRKDVNADRTNVSQAGLREPATSDVTRSSEKTQEFSPDAYLAKSEKPLSPAPAPDTLQDEGSTQSPQLSPSVESRKDVADANQTDVPQTGPIVPGSSNATLPSEKIEKFSPDASLSKSAKPLLPMIGADPVQSPHEASFDLSSDVKPTMIKGEQANIASNVSLSASPAVGQSENSAVKRPLPEESVSLFSQKNLERTLPEEKSKQQTDQSSTRLSNDDSIEASGTENPSIKTTGDLQPSPLKESMRATEGSRNQEQADQAFFQSTQDNKKKTQENESQDNESGGPKEIRPDSAPISGDGPGTSSLHDSQEQPPAGTLNVPTVFLEKLESPRPPSTDQELTTSKTSPAPAPAPAPDAPQDQDSTRSPQLTPSAVSRKDVPNADRTNVSQAGLREPATSDVTRPSGKTQEFSPDAYLAKSEKPLLPMEGSKPVQTPHEASFDLSSDEKPTMIKGEQASTKSNVSLSGSQPVGQSDNSAVKGPLSGDLVSSFSQKNLERTLPEEKSKQQQQQQQTDKSGTGSSKDDSVEAHEITSPNILTTSGYIQPSPPNESMQAAQGSTNQQHAGEAVIQSIQDNERQTEETEAQDNGSYEPKKKRPDSAQISGDARRTSDDGLATSSLRDSRAQNPAQTLNGSAVFLENIKSPRPPSTDQEPMTPMTSPTPAPDALQDKESTRSPQLSPSDISRKDVANADQTTSSVGERSQAGLREPASSDATRPLEEIQKFSPDASLNKSAKPLPPMTGTDPLQPPHEASLDLSSDGKPATIKSDQANTIPNVSLSASQVVGQSKNGALKGQMSEDLVSSFSQKSLEGTSTEEKSNQQQRTDQSNTRSSKGGSILEARGTTDPEISISGDEQPSALKESTQAAEGSSNQQQADQPVDENQFEETGTRVIGPDEVNATNLKQSTDQKNNGASQKHAKDAPGGIQEDNRSASSPKTSQESEPQVKTQGGESKAPAAEAGKQTDERDLPPSNNGITSESQAKTSYKLEEQTSSGAKSRDTDTSESDGSSKDTKPANTNDNPPSS